MKRALALVALALLALVVWRALPRGPAPIPPGCAGPPLRSVEKRQQALEDGYTIHRMHDCIDRASYDAIHAEQERVARLKAERAAALAAEPEPRVQARIPAILAEARKGFRTVVAMPSNGQPPLPSPPRELFVRIDYRSGTDLTLPAFVSPDPGDRVKHPAIVWLTGGDTNSLDPFWLPGREGNDQVVRAFRDAGVVMMYPTLRGGNANPGARQYLLGEIDDVLAAAEALSRLPYVDLEQVYLAGHSTGGTLALLVAEASPLFRAVFAFGPVARAERYPRSVMPIDFTRIDPMEARLRSPIFWRDGIRRPTYVIEGRGGNIDELGKLCGQPRRAAAVHPGARRRPLLGAAAAREGDRRARSHGGRGRAARAARGGVRAVAARLSATA